MAESANKVEILNLQPENDNGPTRIGVKVGERIAVLTPLAAMKVGQALIKAGRACQGSKS